MFTLKIHIVYTWIISIIGISLFFLCDVISTFKEISSYSEWILLSFLVAAIFLSNHYKIVLPPDRNALSMDSSIYIASTFIFGLEITLLLLFIGNLLDDMRLIWGVWWLKAFNLATFTIMISVAYFLFTATGGIIGSIHAASTFSYVLALIGYFLINVLLIGIYFLLQSKSRLFPILKDIFIETLPSYIIIYAVGFAIALLLDNNPIFGIIIFTSLNIIFSIGVQKYFKLYEEVANDREYRKQIMNSLQVGILTFDEKTEEISLNDSATNILKLTKDEVEAILAGNRKDPFGNEEFWCPFQKNKMIHYEKIKYKTKNNTQVLLVSQSEIVNHSNKIVGRIYQFIDITSREELEKRIQQSEKLAVLGELSAGAAHEIRNPLTVIKGFLSLMNESFSGADKRKYHVPFLINELNRMDMIVEDMLSLARPSESKLQKNDIKKIVEEVILNYNRASVKDDIQFDLAINQEILWLDAKQMRQIIYNLIRNSSDAMDGSGIIKLYSDSDDVSYQLYIQDTGSGIPEEIKATIFDPFLTSKASGTGLGLTIVQRIVESHHGHIELFSSSANGTTFLITFPLVKE